MLDNRAGPRLHLESLELFMEVVREADSAASCMRITTEYLTEIHVTVRPRPGEDLESVVQRLRDLVTPANADLVKLTVFGPRRLFETARRHVAERFGGIPCPLQWVEGKGQEDLCIAGIQALAVVGVPVSTLRHEGLPVGRIFEAGPVKYCYLTDLRPERTDGTPAEQAARVFELLTELFRQAGLDLSNLARTWMYNADILSWYDAFNTVRTAFFYEHKIFDGLVPASTAVGGKNPAGAALVVAALAVKPHGEPGSLTVTAIPSPLQCPALEYGSSFSRAVEIATPESRRVLISGTASISLDGQTVHVGDIDGQIQRTIEVAEAILESRGMTLDDTTRAVAYFRQIADAPAFERYLAERGLAGLPVIFAEDDVCRDDLLFEIELDAMK